MRYATFGVVRDGMTHVRAIAETPTTDDPSGDPEVQNPASSAVSITKFTSQVLK